MVTKPSSPAFFTIAQASHTAEWVLITDAVAWQRHLTSALHENNLLLSFLLYSALVSWDQLLFALLRCAVSTNKNFYSGGFLQHQNVIDSYHVKKFIKESQFVLFSRQKVYQNANALETYSVFVFITEILWRTFWHDHFDVVKNLCYRRTRQFSQEIQRTTKE